MTVTIHVHGSRPAIVDASDADIVRHYKWRLNRGGYARAWTPMVNGKRKQVLMHQLVHGKFADHVNGDKLDNRRCNLRSASVQQNSCNAPKWRTDTTSRHRGVSFNHSIGKWKACICRSGVREFLGWFDSEACAAAAYAKAALNTDGEFAWQGLRGEPSACETRTE